MYLKSINIKSFRCIKDQTIEFHKGVNILIGENNTGKTAILDAMRLCLGFGLERRELYFQIENFHIDNSGVQCNIAEFHLVFSELTSREQGIFVEMLSISEDGNPELALHVQFFYDMEKDRMRVKYWGGENEGQDIPHQILELLYYTHLGALRDATHDLAPCRGNKISQLFLKLIANEEQRQQLSNNMNNSIKNAANWRNLLNRGKRKIMDHLERVTLQNEESNIEIDFVEATFRKIVENLKIYIPVQAISDKELEEEGSVERENINFNISQNGLGYNNLIYAATVLGDLLERRVSEPDSFIALLIEEPEAHLHPQWQNILFSYLQEIETKGMQVFITSHSPTITAKTDINSIIVLTRSDDNIKSIPLRSIDISDKHKKYLQRFLDVTKCQLFFAKSVILVEGISESILMPSFAKIIGDAYHLEKNAVEVVNINGVAFEPFANLFNKENERERINIKCSIVTDDDRDEGEVSSRAVKALELKRGMVEVYLARKTFEYELYLENESLIKTAYAEIHTQTNLDFEGQSIEECAEQFIEKLNRNRDKAVFAQHLANKIEEDSDFKLNFKLPEYIENAIKWAVSGNEQDTN